MLRGLSGERISLKRPLFTVSNLIPILFNSSEILFPLIITPIDPVMVPGFATILSAATPI